MSKNFILLFTIFLFFSCKKDVELLSFSEVEITTKNNTLVEVFVPKALGKTPVSATINTTIENFIASLITSGTAENNDKLLSVTNQIELFNQEYQSFNKEFPKAIQNWEAQIHGEVTFKSSKMISIVLTSYINTGGVHGNTSINFLNFDAITGKKISKEALLTDVKGFKTIAKSYFEKETLEESTIIASSDFKLPENIGFSEDGIILLYNTYETLPYTKDIIEFTIPFEIANDYLVFDSF
ncbi:PdaC/SigV domain-containing protein [Hyunsoonleella sp. 2307UL5-6]|uniref:DUF3298 and DUF4163 domain-containing protein n=1 Tax=Hyunsoonleella sp. 2307UL5-6 TaxID=3384768 RepID=UPI0039BC75C9